MVGRIQKGAVLQFKALGANANVSLFCVNAEDKLERYNMPDSLKGQHTAYPEQEMRCIPIWVV